MCLDKFVVAIGGGLSLAIRWFVLIFYVLLLICVMTNYASYKIYTLYSVSYLGDDHLILRGGLALLVGTDYLFSSQTRPENLFPGKSRTEYLFPTATIVWKSKKKKKKNGGSVRGLSRGGRTWLSMVCIMFCRLLACNIVYLVAGIFWYCFFSIYVYNRI